MRSRVWKSESCIINEHVIVLPTDADTGALQDCSCLSLPGTARSSVKWSELHIISWAVRISVSIQSRSTSHPNQRVPEIGMTTNFLEIPFNNDCSNQLSNLNVGGLRVGMVRDTNRHIKRTLPPTLTGFAGQAEIRYYVKVTVGRPAFYKENYRAVSVASTFYYQSHDFPLSGPVERMWSCDLFLNRSLPRSEIND